MNPPKLETRKIAIVDGELESFVVRIVPDDSQQLKPIANRTLPDGTTELVFLMMTRSAGQGSPTGSAS